MDYTDFVVDRAQHMRPLEYDLSDNFNNLVRYLSDMGILSNIPVGSVGPSEMLSVNDALSAPLRSLVVGGNCVQNGTPTPSVPVPIQSVINPVITFAPALQLEQGAIVNGEAAPNQKRVRTVSAIEVSNRLTCIGWCTSGDFNWGAAFYDASGAYLSATSQWQRSGNSVTVPSAAVKARLYFRSSTDTNVTSDMFIAVIPSTGQTVPISVTLRGLPDGTRDTATFNYLRASERDGWSWYAGEVTRKTGQTTQATTEGITGTVGVDVLSSTGEITDGPTVIYKLSTPTTEQLPEIELPNAFGPNFTLWATSDATPQLTAQYIRDIGAAINDMQEAIADL